MGDDAIRYGLAKALRRRRAEGGGEGGVCPCLRTLEVLHLSKSNLGYLGPLWLSRAIYVPVRWEEGGREDGLQRLRELYLNRAEGSSKYEKFDGYAV